MGVAGAGRSFPDDVFGLARCQRSGDALELPSAEHVWAQPAGILTVFVICSAQHWLELLD